MNSNFIEREVATRLKLLLEKGAECLFFVIFTHLFFKNFYQNFREIERNQRKLESRKYSNGVTDMLPFGTYSLPKKRGRTGRLIYDGLRLFSWGCMQNKKTQTLCKNIILFWSKRWETL